MRCAIAIAVACASLVAAAPPPPAPAQCGRGVGDGKNAHSDDMALLSGLGWYYSWGLAPGYGLVNVSGVRQEFVAMAWGAKYKGHPLKQHLATWKPHHSTKHLLGFNEPNLRSQSNLSAAAACALWPLMIASAKQHGLSLGSPAANHCEPGGGGGQDTNCFANATTWFDDFFSLPGCGTDTVDFIATHKYGCNASSTVEFVKMLNARYKKPVWLTEFSCAKAPPAKQLAFMKTILPVFDAMPEVIPRYAWFCARARGTDALISNTSGLNKLGQYYNSSACTKVNSL